MPCYQINLVSVEFNVKSIDLLKRAAESLQMTFRQYGDTTVMIGGIEIDLKTKKATFAAYSGQASLNALKKQYAVEAIKEVASRKKKYILKMKSANKMQLKML